MNRRFFSFVVVALLLAYQANAQNCTCESNFEWVKNTFEENDAGFRYIIDKKGRAAYDIHNQLMSEKIKSTKNLSECTKFLYEWLTFFRSGHIGIEQLVNDAVQDTPQTTQPIPLYETVKVDIPKFEKEIAVKKEGGYEGVWQTGKYKIGIQKEGENYIGFIIESGVDTWKPKQVKLKITKENGKEKSTFYMRDHSPVESDAPTFISTNYLQMGQQNLKRLSPAYPVDPFVENYFKAMNTDVPYLEELNNTTLYLRIPSFGMEEKAKIDSVIAANKNKILKTDNLIIDLRNNGGGADDSFEELLPFLYTNPLRTVWVEYLSTKLNNQRMLDFANDTVYGFNEKAKKAFEGYYETLEKHLGEFVNLHGMDVHIDTLETVHTYPKNVGIIINEGNGSTTEQFLLTAKQSKKVKLFGTTTSGALDISNLHTVESPCKEFKLWYCLTKSLRIPDMVIDDRGIQPDYYLDKTIPQYKWVEFVNDILNQ